MSLSPQPQGSLVSHLCTVLDPRVNRTLLHPLVSVLVLVVCAVICGAETFVSIELWGKSKQQWLSTFLDLPNGIPSHDTIGRILGQIDPDGFRQAFIAWMNSLAQLNAGEVVALDGQTLRRSFDRASNKSAIHMVSAFATANNLVLGQLKTADKSNEITAIPRLLELLAIEGCIVTIDAQGCQKTIATTIVERGADYILQVKDNHPTLRAELEAFFQQVIADNFKSLANHDFVEQVDGDHGRVETRRVWSTNWTGFLSGQKDWKKLRSVVCVERIRELADKVEHGFSYYISSLDGLKVEPIAHGIRQHWGIENKVHWALDVSFDQDNCRVRKDNAPENFAIIRHIALNLLKNEKTLKVGVKNKRLNAGWDHNYLLKVLAVGVQN